MLPRKRFPWFFVPHVNVESAVKGEYKEQTTSLGEPISEETSAAHTIFHPKVSYRSRKVIAELYHLTGAEPRDLICIKPDRLVIHLLIAALQTKAQVGDAKMSLERSLITLMNEHLPAVLSKTKLLTEELDKEHTRLESAVRHYFHTKNLPSYYVLYKEQIDQGLDEIKKCQNECGTFEAGYTKEDAMIARATDLAFSAMAEIHLRPEIDKYVDAAIQTGYLTKLEIPLQDDRLVLSLAGGPGSGKGTAYVTFIVNLGEDTWKNVVKIDTDAYKWIAALDFDETEKETFSKRKGQEAEAIRTRVQNRILEMSEKPHTLLDQALVHLNFMDQFCQARILVVSTDALAALHRAYIRGERTGRYEDTETVLYCHKWMVDELPKALEDFAKKGWDATVTIMDNNVPKGAAMDAIAEIDCKSREIEVLDEEKLLAFLRKGMLNKKAQADWQLYDSKKPVNISEYFGSSFSIIEKPKLVLK